MKRSALAICICVVLMSFAAFAQIEEIPGLILSDMQLISQESLPHWTPDWTGPIQAATIAAWFAEHGYPALMQDFNGDGVIDELDTIELADRFGLGSMHANTEGGTTDARLVLGLAEYIAGKYPDKFVLKIYDAGFPSEVAGFDPAMVPGIELLVMENPTLQAYETELAEGEGVIVGIEDDPGGNRYLSGRSFLYEQTSEGHVPVDFAWADEDRWQSGHQGKVLETIGKMDPQFYIEYQGAWTLVEFMLALSPAEQPRVEPEDHFCPEDALAYHVNTTSTGYGDVQIEECVIRDGDFDIYIWLVRNISFEYDGCGLCRFLIPNPVSLPTVSHGELAPWIFSDFGTAWMWSVPFSSCGLQPGDAAVFMVIVPGPTTDTWTLAGIGPCLPPMVGMPPPVFLRAETTGPGEPGDELGCADLTVTQRDVSCYCDPIDGVCTLTVWARVANIGTEPVTAPFDVLLMSPGHAGSAVLTYPDDAGPMTLPFMPGAFWDVELSFTFPMGPPLCPTSYKVIVDPIPAPDGVIPECDEANNIILDAEDCYCGENQNYGACCLPDGSCVNLSPAECDRQGGEFHPGVDCTVVQCPPSVEEGCPDLIIEIQSATCEYDPKREFAITVKALVTNIGDAVAEGPIYAEAIVDCDTDTAVYALDLAADGGHTTLTFNLSCTPNEGCPSTVDVEVDYPDFIDDECDEDNNTDSSSVTQQ